MHTAAENFSTLGAAEVAPAEVTAVVPLVTAWIVISPVALSLRIDIAVPIGKLKVASVGMLTVLADELVKVNSFWYSSPLNKV
jgi:hypothetical protein